MPGFFYFLSRPAAELVADGRLVHQVLEGLGLTPIFSDCQAAPDETMVSAVQTGPTGLPGTVLYPKSVRGDSPLSWTYLPAAQSWRRSESGDFWIGWETESPPDPTALERREVLPGYQCFDKLDQVWHVPIARSPRCHSSLASEFRRTAAGIERIPDPKHRGLWDLSGQIHDWLYDVFTPPDQDLWKYDTAVAVLQTNYRVRSEELNILQELGRPVLTSETIDPILCAVIDNDLPQQLREYLQKKSGGVG